MHGSASPTRSNLVSDLKYKELKTALMQRLYGWNPSGKKKEKSPEEAVCEVEEKGVMERLQDYARSDFLATLAGGVQKRDGSRSRLLGLFGKRRKQLAQRKRRRAPWGF